MNTKPMVLAAVLSFAGTAAMADEPDRKGLLTKIGMTAEAGGGVGGFMDSKANNIAQTQGLWTARIGFGSRLHIGGELAYVGSAQSLDTLGVGQNAILMSSGVEGALRVNILTGMIQPYATAGVGWVHYFVTNTPTNTSDVQNSSNVAEFPLGVGLAVRYSGFVFDARVAFHPAAAANLMANDANLSTWDVGGRVGFEF